MALDEQCLTAGQSIIDEVEAAIGAGSDAKCLETARRVTDLFLASAGGFNNEQVELFDNVLERLVKTIEIARIADISARMALAEHERATRPIAQAPPSVVRQLARNDEIRIAAPVLQESPASTKTIWWKSPGARANRICWRYRAAGG
jgi:uncharacterized protein (DUF2336 family)